MAWLDVYTYPIDTKEHDNDNKLVNNNIENILYKLIDIKMYNIHTSETFKISGFLGLRP